MAQLHKRDQLVQNASMSFMANDTSDDQLGGVIRNNVNVPEEEINKDTIINNIFSPTLTQCDQIDNCTHKELPCLFEFLQTCTPNKEEDLVYGTLCLRHTNATNRTYTALGTQNTVNMQPIYLRPAICEPNLFLWTFLTNVNYAKAKEMISFMNISTTESTNLAKFIMAVSQIQNNSLNSSELQKMCVYLAAYSQKIIKCVEGISERQKILIPIYITDSFYAENKGNKLLTNIIHKAKNKEISFQIINDNTKQYFVPLSMLNLLDQINILSFRMYCGIGQIGLAPNCSVSNGHIYIGTGLSIRNAVANTDIGKLKSHYPEHIYRLIRNIHSDYVHFNYDVLVLLAVPDHINTSIYPQVFIAKRIFLSTTFDIDKLESSLYCSL